MRSSGSFNDCMLCVTLCNLLDLCTLRAEAFPLLCTYVLMNFIFIMKSKTLVHTYDANSNANADANASDIHS